MPSASQHTASAAMQPSQPLPPPPLVPTTHTHFSQSVGSLPFEFRTAAARVPEKLTCVVCGDVLYQPVLLVSCLHSFCGHCAKLRLRAVWECPTCHRAPQLVQPNWPLDNEVAAFLRQYPVRERSPSEKLAIERFYVPGEALLPPARAATVQPSPAAFQPPFVTEAQRTVLVAERAPAPVPAYASALGQRPPKPPAELDGRPVPVCMPDIFALASREILHFQVKVSEIYFLSRIYEFLTPYELAFLLTVSVTLLRAIPSKRSGSLRD